MKPQIIMASLAILGGIATQSYAETTNGPTQSEQNLSTTFYVECLGIDVRTDVNLQHRRIFIDDKADAFGRTKVQTSWSGYIFTEEYDYAWRVSGVSNHVTSFSSSQNVWQSQRQQNVKAVPLGDNPYGTLRIHNVTIDVVKPDGENSNVIVAKAVGNQNYSYGIQCFE